MYGNVIRLLAPLTIDAASSRRGWGCWRSRLTLLSEAPAQTADVRIAGLRKTYGTVVAVDAVDLEIGRGEFFTMLGPSGSGKTTMLRMIAGFERPTPARSSSAASTCSRLPPFDRDVNTVFQDYALFPHMNVLQNVEYGLRVKKVPKSERRLQAARGVFTLLAPEGYRDR